MHIRRVLLLSLLPTLLALPLSAQTVIPAGTTRYQAVTPGAYILNNGVTRSVATGTNETIQLGSTTAGTYTVTVNGTALQLNGGRGIRTTADVTGVNFVINIGLGGLVQASGDDAVQGRGGPVTLTNLGTLYSGSNLAGTPSTAQTTGRGLNLRDVTGGGTITNGSVSNTTALIRADGGDAVRVGSGFTFTNYGTLNAAGVVNDNSANNVFNAPPNNSIATTYGAGGGFSFEDVDATHGSINSTLYNYGTVTGARHGVQAGTAGTGLNVVNYAGGQLIGRNGSGVGFDTTETDPTKILVTNSGIIRGDFAGIGNVVDRTGSLSFTQDGDGDGIDIDGAATILNNATGQILSTGANGYDSGGRANSSEAIAIGGGVIDNYGLIQGANRGIIVNNDAVASRSGVAATTITNRSGATIEGQNGFAIRLENKLGDARDNDTITNYGTILGSGAIPTPTDTVLMQNGAADPNSTGTLDGVTYTGTGSARFIRGDGSAIQMGEGDDQLTNHGTITGSNGRAINMEGGNDTVTLVAGTVTGSINGGTGSNTLNFNAGTGNTVSYAGAASNFSAVQIQSGTAVLGGSSTSGIGAVTVSNGAVLKVDGLVNASGTTVADGGTISGDGELGGLLTLASGATLSLGSTDGTFTLQGGVTFETGSILSLQLGTSSDLINILSGTLTGPASGTVMIDLTAAGGFVPGTYDLIHFDGSVLQDSFDESDFALRSVPGGYGYSLLKTSNSLQVTVVPEPSTYALLGLGSLVLLLLRRQGARLRKDP